MDEPRIEFHAFVGDSEREFIVGELNNHNVAIFGLPIWYPVNFILRSARGEVLGGLLGFIWGGWLSVNDLWVTEAERGKGHATRLMEAAEAYAKEKGCLGAALDTHNPHARALYERLGYQVFGEIPDWPPGGVRTYLKKLF
jgi:GNAT superfamily N-acetyltransferase